MFTALVLSMAMGMLAVPALAGACEEATVTIPAIARGYVYGSSLRFVDGMVTNDSSVTVNVDKVRVTLGRESQRDERLLGRLPVPRAGSVDDLPRVVALRGRAHVDGGRGDRLRLQADRHEPVRSICNSGA